MEIDHFGYLIQQQNQQYFYFNNLVDQSIPTLELLFNLSQILPVIWISIYILYSLIELTHSYLWPTNPSSDDNRTTSTSKLAKLTEIFQVFISDADIIEIELLKEGKVIEHVEVEQGMNTVLPRKKTLLVGIGFELVYWTTASIWIITRGTSSTHRDGSNELLSIITPLVSSLLLAGTWGLTFILEILNPTHLPTSNLLILFILQFNSAAVTLADSLHTLSVSTSTSSPISIQSLLIAFERLPDFVCSIYVICYMLNMSLKPYLVNNLPSSPIIGKERPLSPEDSNTLIGSLTYSWMKPILTLASTRPLVSLDVWALSLNNRSEVLAKKFSSLKEKTLLGKILRASARDILIDFLLKLVAVTLNYSRPFFIQKILENLSLPFPSSIFLSTSPTYSPIALAQIYAIFAFLSMIGRSLAELIHFHHARRIGMRLRIELTVAVFEKGLRRKDKGGTIVKKQEVVGEEEGASVGKVVSLISDDTNRVLRMGCDSHLIYGAPLELVLALFLLYSLMGWSSFVGFSILVIAVPINYSLGKRSIIISKERSAARDARQASLQELISSIRTIKFFGYSAKFIEKTEVKREIELSWMIKDWKNRFYLTSLWAIVSIVVPLFSFYSFVKFEGKELTVAIAFTALSLFSMVRGPLNQIPDFGIRLLQTQVSIKRIESFFQEDEVAPYADYELRNNRSESSIGFKDASFCWSGASSSESWKLEVGDISFPEGKLSIIKGSTGSGKTSLLLALLGEMKVISGSVDLPSEVSYCSQHPWLESASIRDNIIFGSAFDSSRYQQTLEACALIPDLVVLSEGDAIHIGERGVALSGGQKARIALARALYARTKYILLDDVLSAVDSHTSRILFNRALMGEIMKGRTCILVTHHVDLVISGAAYQVELKNGLVVTKGKVVPILIEKEGISTKSSSVHEAPNSDGSDDFEVVDRVKKSDIESWSSGNVKRSIYTTYLRASSYILWSIILILILIRPTLSFGEQYWLRLWGEASSALGATVDTNYYLIGYALIGASSAFTLLLCTVIVFFGSLRASRSIFSELLYRVVQAPPRFFDVTPSGRITNRFTNDISMVDEALASNFNSFATNIAGTVASLLVTTLILPLSFVPIIFFAIIYSVIFTRYLSVNRDLNRIAATTASPIFSGFQELLIGITTIRAFRREKSYRTILCNNIDESLALWYCSCTLDVWLSIRTQLLSAFCLLATATFAIHAGISPGLAGIAISSAMGVIQNLDSLCTSYGRIVVSLNSMERITEYLELPQEPSEGIIPPAIWPSSSIDQEHLIQVKDLSIKYSPELPEVLSNISFNIKPRERVAIVGRTGSGKSTLAMSLLRFVDPCSGSITIDGLSITSINLEELRQRITFLPQDATLFAGSIRSNLDPFNLKTDEECKNALKRVHLHSEITLDSQKQFSAGEKQLIALARALLRDSKVIIFDESTANVDFSLDEKIQHTIRTEFHDACLITIAHRLRTVIDYDRVLVLEAGKLVEFDTPANLLKIEDGYFKKMCMSSGDYEELVLKVSQS